MIIEHIETKDKFEVVDKYTNGVGNRIWILKNYKGEMTELYANRGELSKWKVKKE